MKIRLEAAGYFDQEGKDLSESVYERPVMLVYTGSFDSMDGPVTIDENHIKLIHDTHNSAMNRLKRMATGEIPMRECPPLQLDHSPSAQHTVGRLVGPLSMGHIDVAGEQRMALFGTVRFLGNENIEKAKDGRWTHVSIGADLESGKLNELSVTPFPAAIGASLLSKKRLKNGEHKGVKYEIIEREPGEFDIVVNGQVVTRHAGTEQEVAAEAVRYIEHEMEEGELMHEKMKKHLMEHRKLGDEDAEKLAKDMLTHHMKHMNMDEEKMSKHMESSDEKELSRMASDHDKHLADEKEKEEKEKEKEKEKEAKMAADRAKFVRLAKDLKNSSVELKGELRVARVGSKLSKLRADGKLTPAEIKNINLSSFRTMTDSEVDAQLSAYEALEPRVQFGVMKGTTKAEAISKVHQKYRMARLELESRMNMPSKRKEAEIAMGKLMEEEKRELAEVGNPHETEVPTKGILAHPPIEHLYKLLDEGKHEELKHHLRRLYEHLASTGEHLTEGDDQRMSALAKTQSALQNQFDELIALASPVLGVKLEEI